MKVVLVKPQGYCAGVLNAIKIAKEAKEENPNKKVYVLGMLVHNKTVINELSNEGIITLESDNIPDSLEEGDVIIFTAHGHDEKLDDICKEKRLIIYDCTCPIVKKNLDTIKEEISNGHEVIYIGQKGHKETNAALSISQNVLLFDTLIDINYNKINDLSPLVINQTTLNFLSLSNIHNEIKKHIPNARILDEVCAATRLRQEAILSINNDSDLILIVGDKKSSNSNKLFDIASNKFTNSKVIMVENLNELKKYDLKEYKKATIASGASTPIKVVNEIQDYLLNNFR